MDLRADCYFSAAIYPAISAISARLRDKVGMFGCGLSKRNASLLASKAGILPIDANGGA